MEKCTYCLQRIAEARIAADRENRPVGEVRTACQAACPTQAFTFGNMADPDSDVSKRKQSPLAFACWRNRTLTHARLTRPSYATRTRRSRPAAHERHSGALARGPAAPLDALLHPPRRSISPDDPVVYPGVTIASMTDQICAIALRERAFLWWWIAFVPAWR